jgi:integrase
MTKRTRSYGDGGIDQRGESFRLRYRVGKKRLQETFHGTLAEAKKRLTALQNAVHTGEHVDPDRISLAIWAEHWLKSGAPGQRRQQVGARSLERYEQLLRTHVLPILGQHRLQQLQSTDIDNLYLGLEGKIAPRTARSVHTTFGACLGAAVRAGKLKINPLVRVMKTPSAGESDHGVALDDVELRKLIQGFKGSSLYALVNVAAFTGARRNEILALRWSDFDPQRKELRIERALEKTKTHGLRFKGPKRESHKRTIVIDDDLCALLLSLKEKHQRIIASVSDDAKVDLGLVRLPEGALIFPEPSRMAEGVFTKPRSPRGTSATFERKVKRLGFKLRFHDLRGTHSTLLLDHGVPPHVVAARCGQDPATLLRSYAKRTHKADMNAASVISNIAKGILK